MVVCCGGNFRIVITIQVRQPCSALPWIVCNSGMLELCMYTIWPRWVYDISSRGQIFWSNYFFIYPIRKNYMCKLLSNPVIVFLVDFTVPPETRDFFNPPPPLLLFFLLQVLQILSKLESFLHQFYPRQLRLPNSLVFKVWKVVIPFRPEWNGYSILDGMN